MEAERFTFTVESLPKWNTPAVVRLRKFLKSAVRAYGLKCVAITDTQEQFPVQNGVEKGDLHRLEGSCQAVVDTPTGGLTEPDLENAKPNETQ